MGTETEQNPPVDTGANNPENPDVNNPVDSENSRNDDSKKTPNMFHWWFGSIFLTFFPTLAVVIMSLTGRQSVDFVSLVSDGELVLCSFLISAGAAWSNYEASSSMNKKASKAQTFYFYMLSFIAFLELISYSSVKLNADNPGNSPVFVCIISVLWLISSISLAWRNKRLLA